jgi:hypothetical protein
MWLRHTLARVLGSLRACGAPEAAPLPQGVQRED